MFCFVVANGLSTHSSDWFLDGVLRALLQGPGYLRNESALTGGGAYLEPTQVACLKCTAACSFIGRMKTPQRASKTLKVRFDGLSEHTSLF